MIRDPFGFTRLYYAGRHHAATVHELFARAPELPRTLDDVAVTAHFAGQAATDRTLFAAIRAVPPGHALVATAEGFVTRPHAPHVQRGELGALVRGAIAAILARAPRPLAVALSGGLDSAIVLALARELEPAIEAIVLAPRIAGYSELDAARTTARQLGTPVRVVEVTEDDLRAALPAAIAALEVPLYNLHPVAKFLLARAAREAGLATVVSGDGVDQVVTRDVSADYLPLASAAFAANGVALHAPFLDDGVVAHLLALDPDPDKRALRELGATLPIPRALVTEPKTSRLAPPIALDDVVPHARLEALARLVGRALPPLDDDRTRVRWATLALLVDAFGAWR